MIPRVKVNYGILDLIYALFISEDRDTYRNKLMECLKQFLGQEHILLTPSGRASLYYLLKAIGCSRVVIPAYTCTAVVESIRLARKEVIFVDIDEDGFNMSTVALEQVLRSGDVVIATHQFGIPCKIKEISYICRQKNAILIEDVAASLGSKVEGSLTGSFGDAAFYSFDSTKLLNVPLKGGALHTKSKSLYENVCDIYITETKKMPRLHKIRLLITATMLCLLKNSFLYSIFHFIFFKIRNVVTQETSTPNSSINSYYLYDMTNWQSYILINQLNYIDQIIKTRQTIYNLYIDALSTCKSFSLPPYNQNNEWACIRFPIRIKKNKMLFYKYLASKGIDCGFSFTYIPCPNTYINAHSVAESVLNLPYYFHLSKTEFNKVISILKEVDDYMEAIE